MVIFGRPSEHGPVQHSVKFASSWHRCLWVQRSAHEYISVYRYARGAYSTDYPFDLETHPLNSTTSSARHTTFTPVSGVVTTVVAHARASSSARRQWCPFQSLWSHIVVTFLSLFCHISIASSACECECDSVRLKWDSLKL